jgi:uncharacterized iron-regulated protein
MFRILLILIIWMVPNLEAHAHTITRLSDGQSISISQLATAAGNADLLLVGENHDDKSHHDLELELIRALSSRYLHLAIGMEMMQADNQKWLDEWIAGRLNEAAMRRVFEQNWADWNMYREIFTFARDNHIPMVALNVPLGIVKKVAAHGFASLTAEERKDLPDGTSCDLSNPQIALLRQSFRGTSGHLNAGKEFSYFCEAQTVRNSGMAINMVRFLQKHPRRKIVTLTGTWHAIKYAIPDQLERYGSKFSYKVVLPRTPELLRHNFSTSEADFQFDM